MSESVFDELDWRAAEAARRVTRTPALCRLIALAAAQLARGDGRVVPPGEERRGPRSTSGSRSGPASAASGESGHAGADLAD